MNTHIEAEQEQVPCIKLIKYKILENADHTFSLTTIWEDQCHHQYVELFHDNGDDTQGVWTECIEHLPTLQHAAAELHIQVAEHAEQGGYTVPDKPKEVEIEKEAPTVLLVVLGIIVPILSTMGLVHLMGLV